MQIVAILINMQTEYKPSKEIAQKVLPSHLYKAQYGQTCVKKWLSSNGFTVAEVSNITANGVDIVAIKNGRGISVDVKTSSNARINRPHPKSDFVAVVMPSGSIHIEQTTEWMRLVQKDGSRSMKKLFDFYELIDAKTT